HSSPPLPSLRRSPTRRSSDLIGGEAEGIVALVSAQPLRARHQRSNAQRQRKGVHPPIFFPAILFTAWPCTHDKGDGPPHRRLYRSEEHTSELQSRFDLVCRLL